MGGLTRDGTAEPVSRDKKSRHELELVKKVFPLFRLSQEGTELVPNKLKMIDHTDKHTAQRHIQSGFHSATGGVSQSIKLLLSLRNSMLSVLVFLYWYFQYFLHHYVPCSFF